MSQSRGCRWRPLELAATFFVLFAICVAMALPEGRATGIDFARVPADASITVLLPKLGKEDPSGYLRAGYDIARVRGIPAHPTRGAEADRATLNIWPPGMAIYYAALFSIFGGQMPVGVVAALTMAFLWALLLTAYVDLLARRLRLVLVIGMVAAVVLTDVTREWVFGAGLLWSEGLFTWFVLAAFYAAARSATAVAERARLTWAGTAGALLGLGAYVRTVGDLFGWLMIVVLIVWGVLTVVTLALRRGHRDRGGRPSCKGGSWSRQLLGLLLCAMAFQVITVPWRIYAARSLRPGDYSWSMESNRLWHRLWTPDGVFVSRGLGWLVAGRPNTPCHVDPDTCRKIAAHELRQLYAYSGRGRYTEADYRRLAIQALADDPVAYTIDRLEFLRTTWSWRPTNHSSELVQNGLLTAAVIGALVLSARRVMRSGPELVALLYPGLTVVSMLPFVFFHYEARYFVPLKLVSVVVVFLLLALDRQMLHENGQAASPTSGQDEGLASPSEREHGRAGAPAGVPPV